MPHPLVRWGEHVPLKRNPNPEGSRPHRTSLRAVLKVLTREAAKNPELLTALTTNRVAEESELHPRTAMGCLEYLRDLRYIEDTSQRTGQTNSIIIYRMLMANHPIEGFQCLPGTVATVQEIPAPIKDINNNIQRDFYENFFKKFAKQQYDPDPEINKTERKKAKAAGWKEWQKINPDEVLIDTIMKSSERHTQACEKVNANQITLKHPATFLKNRPWEKQSFSPRPEAPERVVVHASHKPLDRAPVPVPRR